MCYIYFFKFMYTKGSISHLKTTYIKDYTQIINYLIDNPTQGNLKSLECIEDQSEA